MFVGFVSADNIKTDLQCTIYGQVPTAYDYQGTTDYIPLRTGTGGSGTAHDNMITYISFDLDNYTNYDVDNLVFEFRNDWANNEHSSVNLEAYYCSEYLDRETCSIANWNNYTSVYTNCTKIFDVASTSIADDTAYTINITNLFANDSDMKFTIRMNLDPFDFDTLQRALNLYSDKTEFYPNVEIEASISCDTDWTCFGYDECNATDQAPCDDVVDNNVCGFAYTGDYSEFSPLVCDYCSANVGQHNQTDCINNLQTTFYLDSNFNTCCNLTGIEGDCEQPTEYISTNASCSFQYDEGDLAPSLMDMIAKFFVVISTFAVVGAVGYIMAVSYKVIKGKK